MVGGVVVFVNFVGLGFGFWVWVGVGGVCGEFWCVWGGVGCGVGFWLFGLGYGVFLWV